MKRLKSVKYKVKQSMSKQPMLFNGITTKQNTTVSVSKSILISIDSKKPGPSSREMHIVSEHTLKGIEECYEVYECILKYIDIHIDLKNYVEIVKLLTLLKYILIAGSLDFYYIFSDVESPFDMNYKKTKEIGKIKLKAIYETMVPNQDNGDVFNQIISKIELILMLCENDKYFNDRRAEYASIRDEIHTPTSRHSFEVPSSRPFEPRQGQVRRAHTLKKIYE